MSRIATVTTVLCLAAAPAAFADGPAFHRNINDIGKQAAPAVVDLRSPDAVTPVQITTGSQDLRSPDAVDVFVPSSPAPHAAPAGDGGLSAWAYFAMIAGALAACALLIVMLRRAFELGRPVGA
jgi:hypothetical protein